MFDFFLTLSKGSPPVAPFFIKYSTHPLHVLHVLYHISFYPIKEDLFSHLIIKEEDFLKKMYKKSALNYCIKVGQQYWILVFATIFNSRPGLLKLSVAVRVEV